MKDLLIINFLLFVLVVTTFHPVAFVGFDLAWLALACYGIYNVWCSLS